MTGRCVGGHRLGSTCILSSKLAVRLEYFSRHSSKGWTSHKFPHVLLFFWGAVLTVPQERAGSSGVSTKSGGVYIRGTISQPTYRSLNAFEGGEIHQDSTPRSNRKRRGSHEGAITPEDGERQTRLLEASRRRTPPTGYASHHGRREEHSRVVTAPPHPLAVLAPCQDTDHSRGAKMLSHTLRRV